MKYITILGSTGSIGQNTLRVIRDFPDKFRIAGLSTNSNVELLYEQIKLFHPAFVCVKDDSAALKLESKLNFKRIKLFVKEDGLNQMLQEKKTEMVVLAISGTDALLPLLTAIDNGKDIALANKEAVVSAGPIIIHKAKKKKVKIIPIDSEQSAIWQCLNGQDKRRLKNIYLTASGGPLYKKKKTEFKHISVVQVLKHPCWKMGKKNTVDSATLMNKGLEILETMSLFNIAPDIIKVLIHPQALIHSLVEFIDGTILAQLSITDMRIPIQYALAYPQRLSNRLSSINFYKIGKLTFAQPDFEKFPCLKLAYQAANEGGTLPAVLNAANEVSVNEFLKQRLKFISIPQVIAKVINRHKKIKTPNLGDILDADAWAKQKAYQVIQKLG